MACAVFYVERLGGSPSEPFFILEAPRPLWAEITRSATGRNGSKAGAALTVGMGGKRTSGLAVHQILIDEGNQSPCRGAVPSILLPELVEQ